MYCKLLEVNITCKIFVHNLQCFFKPRSNTKNNALHIEYEVLKSNSAVYSNIVTIPRFGRMIKYDKTKKERKSFKNSNNYKFHFFP